MAVTQASLTSGTSVTNGTSFGTSSVTPTANRLILITVVNSALNSGQRQAPTGVSGNGITYALVAERTVQSEFTQLSVWRGMAASPSAGAITISFGNTMEGCLWSVSEFDGVDTSGTNGSGAIVQSAGNNGTGTSITATLSAFGSSDNATYGAGGWDIGSSAAVATATAGTGFTEIHDVGVAESGGFGYSLHTEWRNDNDTTVDNTWSASSDIAQIGVEIKAASSAITSTLASTLAGVTAAFTGVVDNVTSTLASTLSGFTASFTASSGFIATVASTLSGVTAAFQGTVSVIGTMASTLTGVTASFVETVAVNTARWVEQMWHRKPKFGALFHRVIHRRNRNN